MLKQMLTFICQEPDIQTASTLAQRFFRMVRERQTDQLDRWFEERLASGLPDFRTFAESLKGYSPSCISADDASWSC